MAAKTRDLYLIPLFLLPAVFLSGCDRSAPTQPLEPEPSFQILDGYVEYTFSPVHHNQKATILTQPAPGVIITLKGQTLYFSGCQCQPVNLRLATTTGSKYQ